MSKNALTLRKTASFSDIHWGAKSNSEQHNQDCLDYITWFCERVKADPEIDNIIFMGDWFENRAALNVMTLNYSYHGAKMLNDLDLPIYFIIGNHDLFHRHTRELYSPINFKEFKNFSIIDEPTVVKDIGNGVLLCPYLFSHEYAELAKYNNVPVWWGHFEFKGFVVTGYDIRMQTGPDPEHFGKPKRIFSGHFHKRQVNKNIVYIGNTFPTNFSDADDFSRGMATYEYATDDIQFINWTDCPKYIKTKLTELLDKNVKLYTQSRVKCIVDVPLTFEESTQLRTKFVEAYKLREFLMEESAEIASTITDTEAQEIDWDSTELSGIDDLVVMMLENIETDHIDNKLLIEIYKGLQI